MQTAIIERLAAHSEVNGECLEWRGVTNRKGYGRMRIQGKRWLTHRLAWTARHGEIPSETPCVLHRCDNPPCWRDEHLFLGTKADNNADRVMKGRTANQRKTHCKWGHEFSGDNLHLRPGGIGRTCRACATEASRQWRARQRA